MVMEIQTTLFYVDDDEDDRMFFQEATEVLGETVSLFELADDMLNTLKNPPPAPSMVFLDLNMPVKDGFQVLIEIKSSKAFCHIPVVVLSTAVDEVTVNKCFDLGASCYLSKPSSPDELKSAISKVVEIDWENHKVTRSNFIITTNNDRPF